MGAIQAQDYPMSRWAIGLRIRKATDQQIEASLNNGDLLRTHVLRPTWHIVTSADIRWMVELTAPHILKSMRSRHKQLGLTTAIIDKSNRIIENALSNGYHATREELVNLLDKAKIKNEDNRAAHLLAHAELECLICSGKSRGHRQTYALFSERVPNAQSMSKEDALTTLARRYFQSHGPANLNDFAWWSGLSITDAKHAIEAIKSDLHTEVVAGNQYLFWNAPTSIKDEPSLYLLPAYDEFLISYKDRSPSVPLNKQPVTISSNGIFYPLIVLDSQVIGIWRRTKKSNKILLETTFFSKPKKSIRPMIALAVKKYEEFLGQKITVT
jgi:hypothetical protein